MNNTPQIDRSRFMALANASKLAEGTKVTLLVETMGQDPNDEERTYPVGTIGTVCRTEVLPDQGFSVTVAIGADEDTGIVNLFDEQDYEGAFPFETVDCLIMVEPRPVDAYCLHYASGTNAVDFLSMPLVMTLPEAVSFAHRAGFRPKKWKRVGESVSRIPTSIIPEAMR